jgi:hypothetical protein
METGTAVPSIAEWSRGMMTRSEDESWLFREIRLVFRHDEEVFIY